MEKTASVEAPPLVKRGASNRMLVDFAELIKARLTLLVLVTTAVGFYLGAATVEPLALFHVVFGTALAAAGAAALNQWWEYRLDALMHRTRTRPIPGGRMSPRDALLLGSSLGVAGVLYLAVACNALSALLAAATIGIYLFGYTPLKRISVSNTLVGAVPGALPPMIGWAAARHDLSWPAWSLFAILFCWQMPHFFAIAWMFRDDYARAGFRMLSSRDLNGIRSGRQSVFFAVLLLGASVLPALLGITSRTYLPLVLLLGVLFLGLAVRFYFKRETAEARRLFFGSIIYLPLLLATLVLTKS
ncbi:MAG: protoheme IX farnesyltransferase [Chthoniobacterales bacterium]|nr:protoheme IX farnesyltransferase [Chthoniobacterales bacterium]